MASRKSILLRLRPDTYAALQRWAADEFRSVNGHIEFLLDQSLRQAGRVRPGNRKSVDAGGDDGALDRGNVEDSEDEPEA